MGKYSSNIFSDVSLTFMSVVQESPLVRNLRYPGAERSANARLQRYWDTLILSMLSQVHGSRSRSPS